MILAGDSDAAKGARPLREERQRIRVNGEQRGKREGESEEKEEEGPKRGRKARLEARTMAVCLVAPSSLSNTPSNIPSAITYSLLYTLPPYVTIFYNSYTPLHGFCHVRKGVETHTYSLLSFHFHSFKIFYQYVLHVT